MARARQPDGLDAGAAPDVGDALRRGPEMRVELSTHELAPDDPAQRSVVVDEGLGQMRVGVSHVRQDRTGVCVDVAANVLGEGRV